MCSHGFNFSNHAFAFTSESWTFQVFLISKIGFNVVVVMQICFTTLHSTHLALRLLIFKTLDASEVLIKPFITQRHKTENSLFLNDTQRLFERE